MTEKGSGSGMVSWELVDALYELHFDCLRKIGFFVKAGDGLGEERTALEVIAEFVKQKESELQELRHKALTERDTLQYVAAKSNPPSRDIRLSPDSVRQEDRVVFGRLREICANGGDEWESLKTHTDSIYTLLKRRQE